MKTLAYFYYKVNLYDSAMRTVTVMLLYAPDNVWARGMLVRCCDSLADYAKVLELTSDMSRFDADEAIRRAVTALRARALLKTGKTDESMQLVKTIVPRLEEDE